MDAYTSLHVDGVLLALGTASAPIVFTSATPGASAAWASLRVGGGNPGDSNASRLSYVTLEGGGANGAEALRIEHTALQADHLTVRNASGTAIHGYDAGGTKITACTLSNVAGFGVSNQTWSSSEFAVTGCYWGAASGPYHATLNPEGKGLEVSDGVNFSPWNPAYLISGDGRLSAVRVASNSNLPQVQGFDYDRIGQLTGLTSRGYTTYTLAYTYDAGGQLLSRGPTAGQGLFQQYRYDAVGRMTGISISSTLGLLLAEEYTYNAIGNLTAVTSAQGGNAGYTYDASNRLTNATGPGFSAGYGYDAAGNRTAAGGVTFAYDTGGRLISGSDGRSYTYDAAGNLHTRTRSGATDTFTWDGQGRLTRISYANGSFSAYGYDDAGRRISKRKPDGTAVYYVYVGDLLVQELNGTGALLASYTYDGLDRPVSLWRGGQTYTYLLDRLGSVRGLADVAGNLVASYRYDPWGNLLASTGTIANPLRFTSREYDEESGLYFYRARYYDPLVGRFISRDPGGLGGDPNLYAYARNNPINYVDPSGEFVPLAPAAAGAARGAATEVVKELLGSIYSGGTSLEKLGQAAIGGAISGGVGAVLGPVAGNVASKAAGAFAKELYNQYRKDCGYNWQKLIGAAGQGALKGAMGNRWRNPHDRAASEIVKRGESILIAGKDKLMQGVRNAAISGWLKYGPMQP
ncbi:MAG: hypothetical protein KJZ86_08810, partial [Caldilineaceae bacterium]|nr:hypothetical protein [Caldilineaceae bacterium]